MADDPKKKAAKKLTEIEKDLTLPRAPDIHGRPDRPIPSPEQVERWLRKPPSAWEQHVDIINRGLSPEQLVLRDVVRSGANIGDAYGRETRKEGHFLELPQRSTGRDVLRRTLSFTPPEYQRQFKIPEKGVAFEDTEPIQVRHRPLPVGRNYVALMKTLGPQYDYPSGGPTGTTKATTDRLERKTAAEKLYEDLIENK